MESGKERETFEQLVKRYPEGALPTKLRRKAVEEFATRDRFDGEPFTL